MNCRNAVWIGSVHETSQDERNISDKAGWSEQLRSVCSDNDKIMLCNRKSSPQEERMFHVLLPVPHIGVFKKLMWRTYSFSWLFFDKRKSRKRCEEMLHLAGLKPVPPLRSCCISRCGVSDGCSGVPVMPVSASVYACIRVWYCAYRNMKGGISHAGMVYFARWKNTARM